MSKNKESLVKELVELGVPSDGLTDLTNAVLTEMLAKELEKQSEEEVSKEQEEVAEEEEEVSKEEEEVSKEEEISVADSNNADSITDTLKLRVQEKRVYTLLPKVAKVEVTNLGEGDAYISTDLLRLSKTDKLTVGSTKVFSDTTSLLMKSASRPTLKIVQYF